MRKMTLLLLFICLGSLAQNIKLAGVDFGLVFDDASISTTNRTLITADITHLFSPSTNSAVFVEYNTPTQEGIVGVIRGLQGPVYYPTNGMPRFVKQRAQGEYDIVIPKSLSDEYLSAFVFLNNYQVELSKANSFAQSIMTNTFHNISTTQLNTMLLAKAKPPGSFTTVELTKFLNSHSNTACCPISLLSFHLENEGPGGSTYLWSTLPIIGQKPGIPIVYYNSQWYMSWWFMESGEQAW